MNTSHARPYFMEKIEKLLSAEEPEPWDEAYKNGLRAARDLYDEAIYLPMIHDYMTDDCDFEFTQSDMSAALRWLLTRANLPLPESYRGQSSS